MVSWPLFRCATRQTKTIAPTMPIKLKQRITIAIDPVYFRFISGLIFLAPRRLRFSHSRKDHAEEGVCLRLVEREPHLIGGSRIGHGYPCSWVGEIVDIHQQSPANVVGRPVELQVEAVGAYVVAQWYNRRGRRTRDDFGGIGGFLAENVQRGDDVIIRRA